jgi:hypothetical protein
MRTTIRFDEALLREVKTIAAASGRTMNQVVEDAVREAIARRTNQADRKRTELPTVGGNGIRPGADINDYGSLLDLMDELDASA